MRTRIAIFASALAVAALIPTVAQAAGPAELPQPAASAALSATGLDATQAEIDAMAPAVPDITHARTHVFAARGYAGASASPTVPVNYGGGALLPEINLYPIFWGSFNASYVTQVRAFLASMQCGPTSSTSCTPPNNSDLMSQYWAGSNNSTYKLKVTDIVYSGTVYTDPSTPPGGSPSTSTILGEVKKMLGTKTPDPKGMYLVFTSNYPKSASFCAWHSAGTVNGVWTTVGYEPNLTGVRGCTISYYASYDGPTDSVTLGANSTANVASHEIYETMTDPMLNNTTGYRDSSGWEISDKCSWNYGATYQNGFWMQSEFDNGWAPTSGYNYRLKWYSASAACAVWGK